MNVDRVEVRKGDVVFNTGTLRKDVEGIRCTMRVTFPRLQGVIDVPDEVRPLLDVEGGERLSSAECYLNGAVNLYVRDAILGTAVAVIRIRP